MAKKQAVNLGVSIFVFAIVLAIAMAVNGILGLSGFESVYKDALVSRYNIDGEYIKGRVESSLDLGKKLYLLDSTVQPLFSEVISGQTGIDHLYIVDESGKILYTTRNVISHFSIPFDWKGEVSESSPYTIKFLDSWYISIPLYTKGTDYTGSLLMEFSQKSISSYMTSYTFSSLKKGLVLFFAAFALYAVFALLYVNKESTERIFMIVLLLGSQLVFAVQNYQQYNVALSDIFNTNMVKLARSISESIKEPLAHVSLDSMDGVDEYLAGRIAGNAQCSGIFITNSAMRVLRQSVIEGSDAEDVIKQSDPDMTVLDIMGDDVDGQLHIALRINRPLIKGILRDMAFDSGTIIIVALIFAFILKNFFALQARRADILVKPEEMNEMEEKTALRLIQISTFVFMFAAYVTLSFIPLYIQDVLRSSGDHFFGLAVTMVESLPVSTYMIGIMISMFVTLFGMRGVTVRKRYIIMAVIFIIGSLLTIVAYNIPIFAFARLICGFGFGGILLSTSSLVIECTSSRTRGAGFGTNAAAFASASIASIPVGGVIVNKFGYQGGILVSMVFAVFFLFFAMSSLPAQKTVEEGSGSEKVSIKDFVRIFFSRHIITYILFINIPFQIIYWGLFQFLLPIYMSDTLKLSQGNIGRILGIFSVVSLFAASVSRLADVVKNDKLLIAIGACFAGAVLILFGISNGGFLLFFAVMVAMGVDNLFIDSIEELYLESGYVKGISEENLLQSYKVIEKVLSVFVPSVTSIIITSTGFNTSMLIIGLYSAIGGALFILFGRNGRWEKRDA